MVFYKAIPKQDVTNQITLPSISCMYTINFLLAKSNISHFPHNWTNWASPPTSSTTVQCPPVIYNPLYEMCNFQHHKNHLLKMQQFTSCCKKIKSNLPLRVFLVLNAAIFHGNILLNFPVHLALFPIMLDKYLKHPNPPVVFIHLLLGYLLLVSFHLISFPYSFQFHNISNLNYCIRVTLQRRLFLHQ
jgi:hypothetical protein